MAIAASYRTRLQFALVGLGLTAIGLSGWQVSSLADSALRQVTEDRLTAIRETKRRQIEDYFRDAASHVLALSSDESSLTAIEQFTSSWPGLPVAADDAALRRFYTARKLIEWYPADPAVRALQTFFVGEDSDLKLAGPGAYGLVHQRYHPTFHRYLTAFNFYDIFLLGMDGRVLYSVAKEIDLGAILGRAPYQDNGLARVFQRAAALTEPEEWVVEDYAPYFVSYSAPAAFLAAPLWRAGVKIGVLAIQISDEDVNRVMTGGRNWKGEGLGDTGHAFLMGRNDTLRSDTRFAPHMILRPYVPAAPVLRSTAPLRIPGLDWRIVAEISSAEAFEPAARVRQRMWITAAAVAAAFFIAAWWLGRAVTRPVLALAEGARRLGGRDFGVRLPEDRTDELGHLAASFNRMAENLERTTVSRDELERLAERLIHAHEEERSRIARELHDDLTQRLAALAIEAGRLKKAGGDQSAAFERVQQEIAKLSDDVHGLSRRLHPSILDELGLVAAIETECRAALDRADLLVDFTSSGPVESIGRDASLTLYRITQESLANAIRHGRATDAAVMLSVRDGEASLEIRDNGQGFDRRAPGWKAGLGLASMQERARHAGGSAQIESAPGRGTVVRVTIPVPGAAA